MIPLAIQAAQAAAAHAASRAELRVYARPPARATLMLDSYVALWLRALADSGEPLCISDLLSRHGRAGTTKSQLSRGIAAAVDRGHAEFVRRGAKGRRYYVITPAGRGALAANTPRNQ